jgi:Zn-dependent M28 family amino/carboxypeptidase
MRLTLTADLSSSQHTVSNVVGYWPGTTSEYVVAGAHYDHLGLGEQYSMAPDQNGTIHPGADDNASGAGGVAALARWFGSQPKMRRGVLFIAFAGEEIGLLGSTHYTTHPLLPLGDAVAMINMDMIGRLRDRKLVIGGVSSAQGLSGLVAAVGHDHPLVLDMDEKAVYGSSDHTAFRAQQIPSLFFFTGLHADYHRPSDTADRIEHTGITHVVEFAGAVIRELAQRPDRLQPYSHLLPSQ